MQYIVGSTPEEDKPLAPTPAEATLRKEAPNIVLGLVGAFVVLGGLMVLASKRR